MSVILISVYCPSISKTYDFWVPYDISVGSALLQFCDAICEHENNDEIFSNRDSLVVSSYLLGRALGKDETLDFAGIMSGDKLAIL